jgi:hypothetical protein
LVWRNRRGASNRGGQKEVVIKFNLVTPIEIQAPKDGNEENVDGVSEKGVVFQLLFYPMVLRSGVKLRRIGLRPGHFPCSSGLRSPAMEWRELLGAKHKAWFSALSVKQTLKIFCSCQLNPVRLFPPGRPS